MPYVPNTRAAGNGADRPSGSHGTRTTFVAGVCIALTVTLCVLLPVSHLRAGAFATSSAYASKPVVSAVQTAVTWPQGTVDVNTATADDLCALTGIGPKLAEAILAEREAAGAFDYPEDLEMVKGIGDKTLSRFYDQLYFPARLVPTSAS
ncbi:MAG: ComEA family DNA-binding protein [Eubacteriales bacterium]|nr:ComEA family DNA-binding protein [Eubacteriales bacterium]